MGEAFNLFSQYKPAAEVDASFDIVDKILSMMEASQSLVFLSFWEFAKIHGPNVAFVESLMKSRGDFDRSAVSEVMDSIKRKVLSNGRVMMKREERTTKHDMVSEE